ncbi:MAG: pirin family protein [Rhizobiaceae bacterium]|nr:pirin family protein [Rhizobiaceae bacterium]
MSFFPGNDPAPGDAFACDQIELMLVPRSHDIGGMMVRRALPSARRRMVGPFIFFDRMGPALLRGDQALDVRPHPHIGLSTVTYLFDGNIRHRDSLGTQMVIQPGDVNLMTAGRGIVHSERSPEELRGSPMAISGLQTWLTLPELKEEIAPVFEHTTRDKLPEFRSDGASGRLVIGQLEGLAAPVTTHHDTLYVDVRLDAGGSFRIPAVAEERAIYTLDGEVTIAGDVFAPDQLLVFCPGDEIVVSSERGAHFMLFGGAAMGSPRYIWWNFVSSSKERIEQAKNEWKTGKFDIVPGDEEEFIPLPE